MIEAGKSLWALLSRLQAWALPEICWYREP
jgi:hypothetical protein